MLVFIAVYWPMRPRFVGALATFCCNYIASALFNHFTFKASMIYSMTGFSARTLDTERGSLHIELKSVNSRFLDFQFRICDELRAIEPKLRELLGAQQTRGKLECRVNFVAARTRIDPKSLNTELLTHLKAFDAQIRAELPYSRPLSVNDILRWPGILSENTLDSASPMCLDLAKEALEEFTASSAREGQKLAAMILERTASMREVTRALAPRIEGAQRTYQEKLTQRLQESLGGTEAERIRQEVILFALRSDVSEELSRLAVHLDEVDRVLASGGAVGKRLDFLMQELNREANTLGSKSVVLEVSEAVLTLKLLIEQMREQVQNLE